MTHYRLRHVPTGTTLATPYLGMAEAIAFAEIHLSALAADLTPVPVADPDEVTDAALDLLLEPDEERPRYFACPGCFAPVHRTDRAAHARECAELRALAGGGR